MSTKSPKILHIDWTTCEGRGLCTELLPTLLTRDECGYPLPHDRRREPHIPAELETDAQRAVKLCPRASLRILSRQDR
ncbi:ferredoxin [Rhodococcus sp. IEGM 1409]|uniref:ferredoxin n=1 Tax=Rhodococcus sp. IEGM 1409 TaxID=3047082 RepID=UPI0024B67105|nr:ferredoxin [Rhodococcus sp. IEGM 1409]MDI9903111.1 ferredoxin [Rhodococcus sp. IEGM 1409]